MKVDFNLNLLFIRRTKLNLSGSLFNSFVGAFWRRFKVFIRYAWNRFGIVIPCKGQNLQWMQCFIQSLNRKKLLGMGAFWFVLVLVGCFFSSCWKGCLVFNYPYHPQFFERDGLLFDEWQHLKITNFTAIFSK